MQIFCADCGKTLVPYPSQEESTAVRLEEALREASKWQEKIRFLEGAGEDAEATTIIEDDAIKPDQKGAR